MTVAFSLLVTLVSRHDFMLKNFAKNLHSLGASVVKCTATLCVYVCTYYFVSK